jgi:hypothetical protein
VVEKQPATGARSSMAAKLRMRAFCLIDNGNI